LFLRRPFAPAAIAALVAIAAFAPAPDAAPPQSRTISFFNIHTNETLTVEYKKNGKFVPEAMDRINWILRDWRKDEKTSMDPALIDLVWEVHEELGSHEPIHIISGYRSRGTNNMLRATVGGQASESRHILGKAMDVHFPDVPVKRIRYSALVRERGGVGYYPTSAIPFVHIDTDRVRHWPRMPRDELALLFPDGHSQHVPADGNPISPADVRIARVRNRDLAQQIAEFQELRSHPGSAQRVAVASAGPTPAFSGRPMQPGVAPPRLVAEPRLVDRPSRLTRSIPEADRQKLTQLASLASFAPADPVPSGPGIEGGTRRLAEPPLEPPTSWAAAPAYDEEHPEELAYRPFPIAPYMTETPSPDDPALAQMVHPDAARTLELLDQAGAMPPMRLRPGRQTVQLLWAQEFKGEAVAVATAFERQVPPRLPMAHSETPGDPPNRLVLSRQP
jgi:uncharacterized protein YcbK (DUF882 family)